MDNFKAGWRAGVQEAKSAISTFTELIARKDFTDTTTGALDALGDFLGVVLRGPSGGILQDLTRCAIRGQPEVSYEGIAKSIESLSFNLKSAFSALLTALDKPEIKGFLQTLGFSIALWGTHIKEAIYTICGGTYVSHIKEEALRNLRGFSEDPSS